MKKLTFLYRSYESLFNIDLNVSTTELKLGRKKSSRTKRKYQEKLLVITKLTKIELLFVFKSKSRTYTSVKNLFLT